MAPKHQNDTLANGTKDQSCETLPLQFRATRMPHQPTHFHDMSPTSRVVANETSALTSSSSSPVSWQIHVCGLLLLEVAHSNYLKQNRCSNHISPEAVAVATTGHGGKKVPWFCWLTGLFRMKGFFHLVKTPGKNK